MPDFTFDGPPGTTYPSSKDSACLPVGTVEPGEIRDLDGPLDHWWRETADADEGAPGPAPATPAIPQAAPPAQVFPQPAPSASSDQQEG